MTFAFTLLCLAIAAGALYLSGVQTKNRLTATTWERLIGQLEAVPLVGIRKVALDYLQPAQGLPALQTDEVLALIGGAEGLTRMQANAEILLQLATFAEQWNQPECTLVGERMRRESQTLRKAVRTIRRRTVWGSGRATGLLCVQEATTSYYLMRQRVLALYETSHVGRHARLSIALGDVKAAFGPAF